MTIAGYLGALHGTTCALDNCNTGLLAPEIVAGWLCDSHNTGTNGTRLRREDSGRLVDTAGAYGYRTHLTGMYVCYSCGHLCECSELYGNTDTND